MDRITINLDSKTGREVRKLAAADFRSVSDYVGLLVERHLSARTDGVTSLMQEARAMGIDPVAAIKTAIAQKP